MGKHTELKLAGPDDPIYKGGLTVFTPRSALSGKTVLSVLTPSMTRKQKIEALTKALIASGFKLVPSTKRP